MADSTRWRLPVDSPGTRPRPDDRGDDGRDDGPIVFFVPARNEGPRLAAVLQRVPTSVCDLPVLTVVVDDGSADDTAQVARAVGARVVSHAVNLGLGAAVRTGFAVAVELGASAVGFCDGDGEYDPAELQRLVAPVLGGTADYVVGSRFAGRIEWMRPHRRFGNRVLTRWVAWTVREPVTDGQSGFRVLSAAAAREVTVAHDYNYAQVITIDLLARGFRYAEVPITYRFRSSGRSFVRLGRYLRRVVPTVRRQLAEIHDHGPPVTPARLPTSVAELR